MHTATSQMKTFNFRTVATNPEIAIFIILFSNAISNHSLLLQMFLKSSEIAKAHTVKMFKI